MNRLKISIGIRTFLERLYLVYNISSLRDVRCDAILQHTALNAPFVRFSFR